MMKYVFVALGFLLFLPLIRDRKLTGDGNIERCYFDCIIAFIGLSLLAVAVIMAIMGW